MASANYAIVCGEKLVPAIAGQIMTIEPSINIEQENVYASLATLTTALNKGVSRIFDELNMIVVLDGAFDGKAKTKQMALEFLTVQDILNTSSYRKVRLVLLTKNSDLRDLFKDTIDGYDPFIYYNTEVFLSRKVGIKLLTQVLLGNKNGFGLHPPETRKKSQLTELEEDKQRLLNEAKQVGPEFLEADKNVPISKVSEVDYVDSDKTTKTIQEQQKEALRKQRLAERENKRQSSDPDESTNYPESLDTNLSNKYGKGVRDPLTQTRPTNHTTHKSLDDLKSENSFRDLDDSSSIQAAVAKIKVNNTRTLEVASIKDIKELYNHMLADSLGTVEEKLCTDHAIISVISDSNAGGSGFVAQTAETYAMLGKSVCIFDLDLDKRSQTLYFSNFDKCVDDGKGLGNALLNVASGGMLKKAAVKVTSNISIVGISRTMDIVSADFTKTIASTLKEILKDAIELYDIVLIDLPMAALHYYVSCLEVFDRNIFVIENSFYKFEHFFGVSIQQLLGDSLLISKPFIQKSSIVLNKYNPSNRDTKGYAMSRARIKDLLIDAGQPYDELFVVGEIPFYDKWEQQYLTNVRYVWKNEISLGVYKNILKEAI